MQENNVNEKLEKIYLMLITLEADYDARGDEKNRDLAYEAKEKIDEIIRNEK
jgi:hypothetical protein